MSIEERQETADILDPAVAPLAKHLRSEVPARPRSDIDNPRSMEGPYRGPVSGNSGDIGRTLPVNLQATKTSGLIVLVLRVGRRSEIYY
jgi:hypothetical protein